MTDKEQRKIKLTPMKIEMLLATTNFNIQMDSATDQFMQRGMDKDTAMRKAWDILQPKVQAKYKEIEERYARIEREGLKLEDQDWYKKMFGERKFD